MNATKKLFMSLNWIYLLGGLLLFVSGLYSNRHGLIDDAYITYQYARNLADGFGVVYFPGGDATEGFTNALWVLFLVPSFLIGIDPLIFARSLSILFALTGAVFLVRLYKLISPLQNYELTWAIPVVLWLGFHKFTYHLMLGLETILFSFLLVVTTYVFVTALRALTTGQLEGNEPDALLKANAPNGAVYLFFLCGAALGLTRPEGFAVTGIMGLALLTARSNARVVMRGFLLFFLMVSLVVAGKYALFGSVIPNSFYLKVAITESSVPGAAFVFSFVDEMRAWFLLCFLFLLQPKRGCQESLAYAAMLAVLAFALLFYIRALPLMAWEHRYLVPFTFVLALAASRAISIPMVEFNSVTRNGFASVTLVLLSVGGGLLMLLGPKTIAGVNTSVKGLVGLPEAPPAETFALHYSEKDLGERLAKLGLGGNLSIAFWDAGLIPYKSGCRFIDLNGLNENRIARMTSGEELIDYVLDASPDIIIFATRQAERSPGSIRRNLVSPHGLIGRHMLEFFDAAHHAGYRYTATFNTSYYDLQFFVGQDSLHRNFLEARLPSLLAP